MVFAHLYYYTSFSLIAILLISLLAAIAGGLLNGVCVGLLQIPDFVATLSTQFIFTGLTYILAIRNEYGQISAAQINNKTMVALGGQIPGGSCNTGLFRYGNFRADFFEENKTWHIYLCHRG